MLKVLHGADIHLDSSFTKENLQLAEMRRGEQRSSFVDFTIYARENAVDLLLLAGDLFDTPSPSPQTMAMVERELRATANRGCEIFIIPGNHDRYLPGGIWDQMELPSQVHLFRSETPEPVDLPALGVTVWGYAFHEGEVPNPFIHLGSPRADRINILLAHADLYSATGDCPITPAQIRRSGFDYIALGHIHKGSGLQREGQTYYAYPGCLEGRDFGECGEKGALLAVMRKENGHFEMETLFRRFSKRRYELITKDVTGIESTEQLLQSLLQSVKEQAFLSDTLLRVQFTGRAKPTLRLHSESSFQELRKRLGGLEIKDQTFPEASEEDLYADPTVRGEFYRSLLPLFREGSTEEKEQASLALRFGLAALDGNDIIDY